MKEDEIYFWFYVIVKWRSFRLSTINCDTVMRRSINLITTRDILEQSDNDTVAHIGQFREREVFFLYCSLELACFQVILVKLFERYAAQIWPFKVTTGHNHLTSPFGSFGMILYTVGDMWLMNRFKVTAVCWAHTVQFVNQNCLH